MCIVEGGGKLVLFVDENSASKWMQLGYELMLHQTLTTKYSFWGIYSRAFRKSEIELGEKMCTECEGKKILLDTNFSPELF